MVAAPFANRVANAQYQFLNTTYDLPMNEPARHGALHGFLCNRSMTVVSESVEAECVQLELNHFFNGSEQGYPFLLNLTLKLSLTLWSFDVEVVMVNEDEVVSSSKQSHST